MTLIQRSLRRFTVRDLILTAAAAALGIAVKTVVTPLIHIVSAPLLIPGGALAGGLYMMWLIMAAGLTGKRGAASLAGFVQAILVISAGGTASHGLLSLVSYTLPGLTVDLILFLARQRADALPGCFFACMAANIAGTISVNMVFFRLPLIPLLLSLTAAALSGGAGGVLAWHLLRALRRFNIIPEI
ncbi:MAG: ECF transporter S component [Oscillospiraceae bacterium]|nr:ECF transporter S component [Oscillospiraceae bacterium]